MKLNSSPCYSLSNLFSVEKEKENHFPPAHASMTFFKTETILLHIVMPNRNKAQCRHGAFGRSIRHWNVEEKTGALHDGK